MSIKEKIGIVLSNKMMKTVVVGVDSRYLHPLYSKVMVKTKRYLVHDAKQECTVGDRVIIKESRPLSKHKSWVFIKIISQSALIK